MLPLRDNEPWRGVAWTILVIAAVNFAVLCLQLAVAGTSVNLLGLFGLIPARFVGWVSLGGAAGDPWRFLPLGTSMFLHDGWLHFATNMVYLWTFGRALEHRLGRAALIALYLFAGVAAALGQLIAHPTSNAAMIGASGAIAGILGAYLVYFPRARVVVAFPFLLVPWVIEFRASWLLLGWFTLQVARGTSDLMSATGDPQVAWWAHATGFIAGTLASLAARVLEVPEGVPATHGAKQPAMLRPSLVPSLSGRASRLPARPVLRPSLAP